MTKEKFLTHFFSLLNENKVEYFVYGEYRNLPKDTGGSDIDMVVSYKDFKKVVKILIDLITNNKLILASFYANANANFFRLLHSEWGCQLDIFNGGFFYKGVPYYSVKKIEPYIYEYNGVKVLNESKGFLVGYFKEIIHNGQAKEKYRKAILYEMQKNSIELKKNIEEQFGRDVLNLIEQNNSLEGLNVIGSSLKIKLRKKILNGRFLFLLKTKLILLKRFFQKKPGYVIVVEGTDGSGKSFIINNITPWLNEGFHNGVVYNHLRPNWLPDIAVVLGKRKKPKEGQVVKVVCNPHAGKQSGFVMSLVRWGWYMLDYTFGFLKKVWLPIHSKSKVFIFDRYYYDYYVDQKRSRTSLPKWVIKFGEIFISKPDLILCLGGNPEKIYLRKPETSLEEVQRQTAVLKYFCDKRKNAVWIDTTLSPEDSVSNARYAILHMLSNKFSLG